MATRIKAHQLTELPFSRYVLNSLTIHLYIRRIPGNGSLQLSCHKPCASAFSAPQVLLNALVCPNIDVAPIPTVSAPNTEFASRTSCFEHPANLRFRIAYPVDSQAELSSSLGLAAAFAAQARSDAYVVPLPISTSYQSLLLGLYTMS